MDELFKMTFDQLQRYRLSAELIEFNRPKKPMRILDAGSSQGFLQHFLPHDTILNLDREYYDSRCFVQGDVALLPFAGESFDVALALDVLEHVPASERIGFLNELARVSADVFMVGAPFKDDAVEEAERLANEFCLKVTGRENERLREHSAEGLPPREEMEQWAKKLGYQFTVLPNGYLYRWVLMICLNSFLTRLFEPWDLIFNVNRMYHRRFYQADNSFPAYRLILMFSKKGTLPSAAIRERFASSSGENLQLSGAIDVVKALASAIDAARDGMIEKLRADNSLLRNNRNKLEEDTRELCGMIDEMNRRLDDVVRKSNSLMDERSREINDLSRRLDETTTKFGEVTTKLGEVTTKLDTVTRKAVVLRAELEGIKSTAAYRLYVSTLGRLRKKRR